MSTEFDLGITSSAMEARKSRAATASELDSRKAQTKLYSIGKGNCEDLGSAVRAFEPTCFQAMPNHPALMSRVWEHIYQAGSIVGTIRVRVFDCLQRTNVLSSE